MGEWGVRAEQRREADAGDYEQIPERSRSQSWLVSWHPPVDPPGGLENGAAGVCVSAEGVVLVSRDGERWGLPGGRPEPGESAGETLRRELMEEACVQVDGATLVGWSRSECVEGREPGLVLIRSYWRVDVTVLPWEPRFEIPHRLVVPAADARRHLDDPDPAAHRISLRALTEALP